VVGKPGTMPTPLLTETMKFITVNPTWNVPPSIIYNEYLPALQQDPQALERMGLKVERTATAASASSSRRASAMRSAASASTSRTSSWSISTTRRTSTCSP
jgi:murein L,D-transpeptidase YcbB/YkuD